MCGRFLLLCGFYIALCLCDVKGEIKKLSKERYQYPELRFYKQNFPYFTSEIFILNNF